MKRICTSCWQDLLFHKRGFSNLQGGEGRPWHRPFSCRSRPSGRARSCRSERTAGVFPAAGGKHQAEGWVRQEAAHHRAQYLTEINAKSGVFGKQTLPRALHRSCNFSCERHSGRLFSTFLINTRDLTHTSVCCQARSDYRGSPARCGPHTSTVPCCRGTAGAHRRRSRHIWGCTVQQAVGVHVAVPEGCLCELRIVFSSSLRRKFKKEIKKCTDRHRHRHPE